MGYVSSTTPLSFVLSNTEPLLWSPTPLPGETEAAATARTDAALDIADALLSEYNAEAAA